MTITPTNTEQAEDRITAHYSKEHGIKHNIQKFKIGDLAPKYGKEKQHGRNHVKPLPLEGQAWNRRYNKHGKRWKHQVFVGGCLSNQKRVGNECCSANKMNGVYECPRL